MRELADRNRTRSCETFAIGMGSADEDVLRQVGPATLAGDARRRDRGDPPCGVLLGDQQSIDCWRTVYQLIGEASSSMTGKRAVATPTTRARGRGTWTPSAWTRAACASCASDAVRLRRPVARRASLLPSPRFGGSSCRSSVLNLSRTEPLMDVYRFTEEGSSHRSRGVGNQDACRVERHDPHCLAFLADGMGSARYGGAAAGIAVGVGLDMARCALVPQSGIDDESGRAAVQAAFSSAYGALQRTARNERELNALLSTLMAVYYNERTGCLHFGYCGDGGLIVLGDDGRMRLATPPHKGPDGVSDDQPARFRIMDLRHDRARPRLGDADRRAVRRAVSRRVVPERRSAGGGAEGRFDAPRHLDDPRMRPLSGRVVLAERVFAR